MFHCNVNHVPSATKENSQASGLDTAQAAVRGKAIKSPSMPNSRTFRYGWDLFTKNLD
jgi:hypothetical protein